MLNLVASPLAAGSNDKSIDDLLYDYRVASDRSNETKQESAGTVIVFSRDAIEKMQAFNLRDILKTIPMFTLQETMTGPVSLAQAGGATFSTQYLKLYINDHELGSVVFGSAMKMWGYMDISHIDHIEIYQTGSAVSAGDEPPGMVVRLYTKDAQRDTGAQIQGIAASRGSTELNGYYANEAGPLSYFVYLDTHDEQRDTYYRGTTPIGRDFKSTNFFGSLAYENYRLDIGRFHLDQDGLFGLGRLKTPVENYNDLYHTYAIFTAAFQQKSLKLKVAYDNATHIRYDNDPSGIALNDGSVAQEWYYDKDESVFDVSLSKHFNMGNNDMELGVQYKHKEYDPVHLLVDGVERNGDVSPYRKNDIYSLFYANNYALDASNLIFTTLKYDMYKRNGAMEDFDNYVARLGYIYNSDSWLWKSFAVHTYGYPYFMQDSYFPFVYLQNSNLKSEIRWTATTELYYKQSSSTAGIRLVTYRVKHPIVTDGPAYVQSSSSPRYYGLNLTYEYRFDNKNRLAFSGYTSKTSLPDVQSSKDGATLQLFSGFGDVDLYNELTYRSGYSYETPAATVDVDGGYDYTLALTYHANDDLTLSLKGENLFDSAIETAYPIGADVEYLAPFDRTVRISMKYVF